MPDTILIGGYLDSDLIMNQYNGVSNNGEVQFDPTIFNFIHPNGTVWENVDNAKGSVSGMEGAASGTTTAYRDAYLVFVGSDENRFNMLGSPAYNSTFVIAYLDEDNWTYDNNAGYDANRTFTPNDNDCIVAQLWRDTLASYGIAEMETFYLPTGNYETEAVNYIPDPSFLTQTWQPPIATPNITNGYLEFSDEESLLGGYSVKHTATAADSYTNPWKDTTDAILSNAAAGQTWSFSAWCKTPAASGVEIELFIFGLDSSGDWNGGMDFSNSEFTCSSTWTEFTHTHTFTDPDVTGVSVRVDNDGWAGSERYVYWDALQLSIDSSTSPEENNPPIIQIEIN